MTTQIQLDNYTSLLNPATGDTVEIIHRDNNTYQITGSGLLCDVSTEQAALQIKLFLKNGFTYNS
jgi:hypothetical protein